MCVRTLTGGEINDVSLRHSGGRHTATTTATTAATHGSISCFKEKHTKSHDDGIVVVGGESQSEKLAAVGRMSDARISLPVVADDILSAGATKYGMVLDALAHYHRTLRRSKFVKILFHTTQPAHVITIAAVLCVTSALVPTDEVEPIVVVGHPYSRITSFVYLASFVVHFGAQIWMTFVSGLSLYFALPRHTFGEVQRVLFPRYFTINACLSLVTLLIFVKHHPAHTWDTEITIQVGGMSGAFFLELLIRLYLTPPLLKLIVKKNTLERAAGVGSEIGRFNSGPLKHCPRYLRIHSAFRRVHVSIAMGNMLSMACTVLHLQYIASKLCVL